MKIRHLLTVALCVASIGAIIAGSLWWKASSKREKWRHSAITELSQLSMANPAISNEWTVLKEAGTNINERPWTSDNVLLMANGEFILYKYRHGANGYFPPHLFIGRASDGRWLSSNYHFCNSMTMVALDPPPSSISDFAMKYAAKDFRGDEGGALKQ